MKRKKKLYQSYYNWIEAEPSSDQRLMIAEKLAAQIGIKMFHDGLITRVDDFSSKSVPVPNIKLRVYIDVEEA